MTSAPFSCVLAGLLVASAAIAQEPPPPPDRAPPARAGHGPARNRPDMEARRAEREQQREADIALLLDLKPDQRGRLHAFLAGMMPPPGMRASDGMKAPDRDRTFGSRLAAQQSEFDTFTSEERARLAAARAFFDGLSPTQRDKFEALQRLDHPRRPPMEHGGPDGPPPRAPEDGPPPPPPGQ